MGVKLFAWLGGLALFFGIAFFVKYSFDHDLIPPAVRVAIGYILGAGVLAGRFGDQRLLFLDRRAGEEPDAPAPRLEAMTL